MAKTGHMLKAIRFRSLDEARQVLVQLAPDDPRIQASLEDGEDEPQGLLAVIPEDRLGEELFYRLFDLRKGVLVDVERVPFSGYGPIAEEEDYMGYACEKIAYVLKGCLLPVSITHCPQGALDIHHLEALVLERQHGLNREDLASRLNLPAEWDFEDLFDLILEGRVTADEIDRLIHRGIQ